MTKAPTVSTPQLTLVQQGKSAYTIALAANAIPAERTAANELAKYIEQISGVRLAIKPESEVKSDAPQILVGASPRAKALLPQQNWEALGTDGIVIKTVGNKLILAGGQPRGTLYAVYTFLEDTLGVRWWTETERHIPKLATIRVNAQNITYVPQLLTREAFYFVPKADRIPSYGPDADFATALKLNGHFQRQDENFGGHHGDLLWSHSFGQLLPPEKYFKDHPEWFSDPANDDKPSTSKTVMPLGPVWNLCLTNEEARKELVKQAIRTLRENPGHDMISITQNDTTKRCTCDADMAIEKAEGSPSGPLLHFVNKVAEELEQEFPNIQIETLAYLHTIKPPKTVRPRKNVVVTLCSIEADFARPLNSEANKVFRDQMLAWKDIAPRLRVWDYTTNFSNTLLPHPNLRVLGPNLRFFVENNAVEVFEQGDAYSNGVGDFVQMRTWLLSHLMWNPALDQRKLEDEFLNGYYGKAAPHLRAYLETVHDAFLKTGKPLSTYQRDITYLDLSVMNTATKHFRAAANAVAGDKVLSERVRRERLALDHVWILRQEALREEAEKRGVASEGPTDFQAFVADFVASANRFGIANYSEGTSFKPYGTQLLARAEPPAPLPAFAQGKNKKDVIDSQESLFTLFQAGTDVSVVDDPKASNGRAAKMAGSSYHWLVQCPLTQTDEFLKEGVWRCYVIARVVPKAGAIEGPAFKAGIYDNKNSVGVGTAVSRTLDEMKDGEYQVIELGAQKMHSMMSFWVQPPSRDDIDGIYIDRFIMIREGQ